MAKDPAFLFYPGDYLRDTQCLSEKAQVAYDRIMCEHMRNICLTQQRLNFFTKRLTEDETEEIKSVLTEVEGGFQIEWVVLSIDKRRAYSESRRQNRKKDMNNTSKTYVEHMVNENENENTSKKAIKKEPSSEVLAVFNHYLKTFNKTKQYELSEKRVTMIKNSLKRYSQDDLFKTIEAMSKDDWEDRHKHDDIKYAVQSTGKEDYVEKWLNIANNTKKEHCLDDDNPEVR